LIKIWQKAKKNKKEKAMEANKKWYNKNGFEDLSSHATMPFTPRFFLKSGQKKEVVFLDDTPFAFYEHQVKIGDKWQNYFVCLEGVDPRGCPLCQNGFKRYYIGFLTIVDILGYVDKKGVEHPNNKMLYPAKYEILNKLKYKRERKGYLAGLQYEILRTSEKAANSGDDFEFVAEVDVTQFKDKDGKPMKPYDYTKLFAPKTVEQLKAVISAGALQPEYESKEKQEGGEGPAKESVPGDVPF
jgi:hypothetical protein